MKMILLLDHRRSVGELDLRLQERREEHARVISCHSFRVDMADFKYTSHPSREEQDRLEEADDKGIDRNSCNLPTLLANLSFLLV